MILSIVGGVCGRGLHFSAFHYNSVDNTTERRCIHTMLCDEQLVHIIYIQDITQYIAVVTKVAILQ